MGASQDLRAKLLSRAGGRCECKMRVCTHHSGRCTVSLTSTSEWDVHRVTAGGDYSMSNCRAMCVKCHENTPSYGRG